MFSAAGNDRTKRALKRARVRSEGECAHLEKKCEELQKEVKEAKKELQLARQKEAAHAALLYKLALGYYKESKLKKYFDLMKQAAECGDKAAQYDVAVCYEHGDEYGNWSQNEELALQWYKKSADQEWEPAMCWIQENIED